MFKFTGNNSGIRAALLVALIGFIIMISGRCSTVEAQETKTTTEIVTLSFGALTVGSESCAQSMLLTSTFAQRKWLGYLATHGESSGACRNDQVLPPNIGVGIIRMAYAGKDARWGLGFGGGVFEHGDIGIGPYATPADTNWKGEYRHSSLQLVAGIMLRRRLGKYFVCDILHNSTGGATDNNRGKNFFVCGGYVQVL